MESHWVLGLKTELDSFLMGSKNGHPLTTWSYGHLNNTLLLPQLSILFMNMPNVNILFCRSLTRILSALLDERLDLVWEDLGSQLLTSTVRRFMDVTEDLGIAMADVLTEKNLKEMGSGIVFVTPNICKFLTFYSLAKNAIIFRF